MRPVRLTILHDSALNIKVATIWPNAIVLVTPSLENPLRTFSDCSCAQPNEHISHYYENFYENLFLLYSIRYSISINVFIQVFFIQYKMSSIFATTAGRKNSEFTYCVTYFA